MCGSYLALPKATAMLRCLRGESKGCFNMAQYRKKPVVINAFQMTCEARQDNSTWPDWLHSAWNEPHHIPGALYPSNYPNSDGTDELKIHTLEGDHLVSHGDWIIMGVQGELYPCKPDIFAATYEAV